MTNINEIYLDNTDYKDNNNNLIFFFQMNQNIKIIKKEMFQNMIGLKSIFLNNQLFANICLDY